MTVKDTTFDTIDNNIYMTLSTVCEDGSPWGTPVHFYYHDKFLYWFSFASATHSQNIARHPGIFVTIFDTIPVEGLGGETGLYIQTVARQLEGADADKARALFLNKPSNDRHTDRTISIYRAAIGDLNTKLSTERRIYREIKT